MRAPVLALLLGVLAILLFAWSCASVRAAECGTASWYGAAHHGRLMANGRPFDMHAMTAASWSYPLGTKVRVTLGERSVVVTITDRGPAKRLKRVIDLSHAAAKRLGMIEAGVARVCVARLS